VAEAILLVGGKGTRLRPLTVDTAKPMLPVAGVPFLTHQLARLRAAGIEHVVLATSYRAETFEDHFGDGSSLGMDLDYVTETQPLGTGGGIRNVAELLRGGPGDAVMILNGDVLSGHDIAGQLAAHERAGADVTLHLVRVEDPRAFGCVPTDDAGRVTAFLEKMPEPVTDQINAGCYVFRRRVIDDIPAGRPVSVERETFPDLLSADAVVLGFLDSSYWLDVGTPAALVRGSCDLVLGRVASPALPGSTGESLVLAGATVAPDAVLCGGTTVGEGARVGAGARVEGSVLLPGAEIGEGATVRASVVGAGAVVGAGTVLDDVVVGDRARVGAGVELRFGARVWPDAVLPDGSVRFSSDG
jgi:mannose-1-phosphate guanylyltransferase